MKSIPRRTQLMLLSACLGVAIAVACGDNTPGGPSSMTGSGAVISGSVTSESAAGLAVRVVGTELSTVVGSKGTFELSGVPEGNHKLQFSKGDVTATADLNNVTSDQFIALQVQVNGTSAVIVSDARSDRARGPSVRIKKFTNGEDADFPPGPSIALGRAVQWRYVVLNNGTVDLTNVHVIDDQGETLTCVGTGTLPPGATLICTANAVVTELGPYRNVGTVTAQFSGPGGSGSVADSDRSHYLGVSPVQIKKFTNGEDADFPPGPSILVGAPIVWQYRVSNIGNATLTAITVTDDQGENVVCPPGQTTLAPGATFTCLAAGHAVLGFYANVGTASATWTLGPITRTVTDSNASHYRGVLTLDEDRDAKVTLCHRTGNGSFHSITVSVNAEPAHLAHGDGKPGGPVPGQPGKIFGPDCSIR
jgi:hypothetical protein